METHVAAGEGKFVAFFVTSLTVRSTNKNDYVKNIAKTYRTDLTIRICGATVVSRIHTPMPGISAVSRYILLPTSIDRKPCLCLRLYTQFCRASHRASLSDLEIFLWSPELPLLEKWSHYVGIFFLLKAFAVLRIEKSLNYFYTSVANLYMTLPLA